VNLAVNSINSRGGLYLDAESALDRDIDNEELEGSLIDYPLYRLVSKKGLAEFEIS